MPQEIIRCPYCVLGDEFRPLLRQATKFVCITCGHSATPGAPYSECDCPKCQEMIRLTSQCRNVDELRRSAGGTL